MSRRKVSAEEYRLSLAVVIEAHLGKLGLATKRDGTTITTSGKRRLRIAIGPIEDGGK